MALNEEYSFSDVRYAITSNPAYKRGYDVGDTFVSFPEKVLLEPGTALARLDFAVPNGYFASPWWMRSAHFKTLLSNTATAAELRREWQKLAALPKAHKGLRTHVIEIQLIEPVYAWTGIAKALFNKPGGVEQVYLPNLCKGCGPNRSNVARLKHTYTVPA